MLAVTMLTTTLLFLMHARQTIKNTVKHGYILNSGIRAQTIAELKQYDM